MQRTCDVCGVTYEAKRATSRYCSTKCRTRKARGAEIVDLPAPDAPKAGPIESAARDELEAVDRLATTLGQQAIAAARRLDNSRTDTGSAYGSLNRELRETMAAATRGVHLQTSPQALRDELSERRARHGA